MSQDFPLCGNYLYTMAETTLLTVVGSADQPAGLVTDWARILAEHDRWLRTVVLNRLGEQQAVEEVMQEVALAAVAQRAPLGDVARVGGWLYRLAIRQALLYRRRRGRQRRLLDSYAGTLTSHEAIAQAPDPLDRLLHDERQTLVRESLRRLPRRDAEILLLKYTEDWSYRELAAHLGVSESAIEARLHRARNRLRRAISGTDVIEAKE
jgi:RNA polymerase sigma-70 factor (ECF subfamily)